jgi:serine protease AprX
MASDARDTDYIIIQTRASLTSQEKDELNQADVQVLELLSLNTYLCRYLPQDLQVLRQKSYIAHVDVYHSHLKIHADIQRHAPALRVSPVSLLSATSAIGSSSSNAYEEVHLSIGFHNSDDSIASETLRELVEKQLVDPSRTPLDGNRIDTVVPSSSIPSLLKIDAIKIIEPTSTLELRNDHARNVLAADTILNNTIFRGTNQIIALGDTGFDVGVTASTGTRNLHPAFTGRVLKAYNAYNLKHNLNNTNPADVEDTNGHGTHCAGSAVGADIPGLNGGQNVNCVAPLLALNSSLTESSTTPAPQRSGATATRTRSSPSLMTSAHASSASRGAPDSKKRRANNYMTWTREQSTSSSTTSRRRSSAGRPATTARSPVRRSTARRLRRISSSWGTVIAAGPRRSA